MVKQSHHWLVFVTFTNSWVFLKEFILKAKHPFRVCLCVMTQIQTKWFQLIAGPSSLSSGAAGANTTGRLPGPNPGDPQRHQLHWHQPASGHMIYHWTKTAFSVFINSPTLCLYHWPNNIIDPTPFPLLPSCPLTAADEEVWKGRGSDAWHEELVALCGTHHG